MKNLNYLVVVSFSLLIGACSFSCTQDQASVDSTANLQHTIDQINEITDAYMEQNSPSRLPWVEYLDNDIYAFFSYDTCDYPYHHDTTLSERFNFAADYSAWKGSVHNDGTGNIATGTIVSDVALSENKYDYVGLFHVQILDHIVTDKTGRFINGNDLNYEAVLNYNNQFLISKNFPICTLSPTDLKNEIMETAATFNAVNHTVSNAVIPNSNAEVLLKNYFLALENSNSATAFTAYSKNIELLIINSQQFSEVEEEFLLTNMATARHDFSYWMTR